MGTNSELAIAIARHEITMRAADRCNALAESIRELRETYRGGYASSVIDALYRLKDHEGDFDRVVVAIDALLAFARNEVIRAAKSASLTEEPREHRGDDHG